MADSYELCLICNGYCPHGKQLSDGRVYDEQCYNDLLQNIENFDKEILNYEQQIYQLNSKIRETESMVYRLKSFVFGDKIDISKVHLNISELKQMLSNLNQKKQSKLDLLKNLYDFWPNYPPDWKERGVEIENIHDGCHECGSYDNHLHTHHKIPLSRGGSNKIENLALLCEDCHSQMHGGRNFNYDGDEKPVAFVKRLEILRQAIHEKQIVHFSYKKFSGEKSVRSITPEKFEKVGESLCVSGYCFLRKEERIFAIKRMKGVKIVEEPGKCYNL